MFCLYIELPAGVLALPSHEQEALRWSAMDESGEVRQDGHERARDGPTRQLPAGSQGDEREQPQKHEA